MGNSSHHLNQNQTPQTPNVNEVWLKNDVSKVSSKVLRENEKYCQRQKRKGDTVNHDITKCVIRFK